MLTEIVSCKTGKQIAPPSLTTFSPPIPVRTKAISLVARTYNLAKISPIVMKETSPTPTIIKIKVLLASKFPIVNFLFIIL